MRTGDPELLMRLNEAAAEAGISKLGIVNCGPLDPEGSRLGEWLSLGYHGEMRWMERDPVKRADPTQLLEGARSMIVAAVNYHTPHSHSQNSEYGKISRYAWGDDYHLVVKEKLTVLLDAVRELLPDANGRVFVDTAPILEKAWAVRAGIGWLGKHTNVISREFGSWVFLGEIILDTEIAGAKPQVVEDHCGSCTECIDACPTGAIVKPYVVDSNLCISHATIESREEEIAPTVAENLQGWLYGCDICQDVCPWNRFSKETDEKRFEPRENTISPKLTDVLSMPREEYTAMFRRSAIKRAKLKGLKRNARALSK